MQNYKTNILHFIISRVIRYSTTRKSQMTWCLCEHWTKFSFGVNILCLTLWTRMPAWAGRRLFHLFICNQRFRRLFLFGPVCPLERAGAYFTIYQMTAQVSCHNAFIIFLSGGQVEGQVRVRRSGFKGLKHHWYEMKALNIMIH